MLFLQEEVKAKRLQSMGELPGLLPTSSSYSRPSNAGLSSSDTVDVDDDTSSPAVQPVDTINKSPVNASNSECF